MIEVRDKLPGDSWVLNLDATLAAQGKAAELGERFAEWAWEDSGRAGELAGVYNEFTCQVGCRIPICREHAALAATGLSPLAISAWCHFLEEESPHWASWPRTSGPRSQSCLSSWLLLMGPAPSQHKEAVRAPDSAAVPSGGLRPGHLPAAR